MRIKANDISAVHFVVFVEAFIYKKEKKSVYPYCHILLA